MVYLFALDPDWDNSSLGWLLHGWAVSDSVAYGRNHIGTVSVSPDNSPVEHHILIFPTVALGFFNI